MPNFAYHLARAEGHALRRLYAALLPAIVQRPVRAAAEFPMEVYAYSGEGALPEQVASIRSFLRYAGRPRKFTIVSDGTHSRRSLALLQRLDPCIALAPAADWFPTRVPERLHSYLTNHPTGKQLALIMSLPENGPALYIDSDVLFFPGARALAAELTAQEGPAAYLQDCQLSADERILRDPSERADPVNTGVLFLREKLDWSASLARLVELEGAPSFFTNQTATHVTMHASGAHPLDARKFVLQLDDQVIYRDRYASAHLILRHYVSPVRHKFWTTLCRSH